MLQGVITGVVGSATFALIVYMVKTWVWPLYLASTYQGAKISDEWEVFYDGDDGPAAVLSFEQRGITVRGLSKVNKNKKGEQVDRRYKYRGKFLDGSLVLTFEDLSNPHMRGGAMVFHYTDTDVREMRGISIYFKQELAKVDSSHVTLRKKLK